MKTSNTRFRAIFQSFERSIKSEDLEVFGSTTLNDVHNTISTIQARQETERTMMDLTRVSVFLDRMHDLSTILSTFNDTTAYMAFVWGPFKAMLHLTSQDSRVLDILLDAYDRLGNTIPVLQEFRATIDLHPELWKVLELIYQDVLQFHESVLRFSNHPNMRTLFRSMWNDYAPRFETKLKNLENHRILMTQLTSLSHTPFSVAPQVTVNVQLVNGNTYGDIQVDTGSAAVIGDFMNCDPQRSSADTSQVLAKLRALELNNEKTRLHQESQEKQFRDERFVKIREWIAGSVPYKYHESSYSVHLEYSETGLWILGNQLITAWMKDDLPHNPILWVHGLPGAGKTILASILINACEEIENSHTAYFYCKHDDQDTRSTLAILKGLLMQAVGWRPDLMSYFDEQRKHGGEPIICKDSTARRLTSLICHDGGQVYLVIDGIDECSLEDRKSTLTFLSALVQEVDQKNPGKLRLMIISQSEPDIRKALVNPRELQIDKTLNGSDIRLYSHQFAEKIRSKFGLNEDIVGALQRRTCWYAAGQFLYAKLVLENLLAQPTLLAFQNEMREPHFPKQLSEAYERIISRIKNNLVSEEWDATQRLLGWMTCAVRPLRWHEMQGALSIDFEELEVDFELHSLRKHAQDLCGALVTVHEDRISLVHMTAREFIEKSEHIDHPSVECQLANLCIRYLGLPCFDAELNLDDLRYFLFKGNFAFADYAAAKWIYHLHRIADQATALSDRERWDDREDDVNELLGTMHEFSQTFRKDLVSSQGDAESRKLDTRLSPAVLGLLDRCSVEEAEASFQMLWTHAEASRTGDVHSRHRITLERLRRAMEKMRELLEDEYAKKELSASERNKLRTYYGDKIYRCPKTSCYFFHQGFRDRHSRDKHVARHERVYECSELDCPAAEFGFGDKKALQAHVLESHPDSELKAMLFEKPAVKHHETDFRCEKCDRSFARNAILQAHQRAHAGQKPYECSRCGKGFVRKWDCTRHEKSHENRIRT